MLWLARPPYLRWFAAGAIVVAALGWDLSGRRTEPYPFAAQSIARGAPMSEAAIEWRDVPLGIFAVPELSGTSASVDITRGDPITESVVSEGAPLPEGWWSVPIDLPVGTPPGTPVRVVLPDGTGVGGIVTQAAVSDAFGSVESGVVGFPETVAGIVAQLAAIGDLVVLVEP